LQLRKYEKYLVREYIGVSLLIIFPQKWHKRRPRAILKPRMSELSKKTLSKTLASSSGKISATIPTFDNLALEYN